MSATPEQKKSNDRGRKALRTGDASKLGRLAELLDSNGVDLADVGEVKQVRLNEWQGMYAEVVSCEACHGTGGTEDEVCPECDGKQTRRVPRVVDMKSASIVLTPSWDSGPKWPVVQPSKPVAVKVPKRSGPALVGTWKTCVFLPDAQIGFRRLADGELDPFHDPRAIDVATQIVEVERPDGVIHAGDFEDFAPFGRYRNEAGFAMTVQPAIQYGYEWLAILAELCRWQKLISGNHDVRLQNYIIDNAIHAFGISRAKKDALTKEWPVLSLQNLLRLDELGVEYVGSYPAGATYLNDNLAAIHGAKIGNRTRTAAQIVVEDERVSILHGHTHKRALASKTRNSRGAPKFSVAFFPGCLCRIDGAVPSVKGAIDAFGAPVKSWEDWQQGVGVIRYQDGNGKFAIEDVPIFEGWAMHRGQEFTTRPIAA
jgi:predicted phosphodiesterase